MLNPKQIARRFVVIFVAVLIGFVAVIVRLFWIQTVERESLMGLSGQSIIKEMPATRGNIYACDGKLLASTVPYYSPYMDTRTAWLRKNNRFGKEVDSLAVCLANKFGDRSAAEYKRMLVNGYNRKEGRLRLYPAMVSYNDMQELKTFPLFREGRMRSGLFFEERVRRIKPFGSLASRTIGDIYGQAGRGGSCGLELAYDSILRGRSGLSQTQHLGTHSAQVPLEDPEDGLDITTTLDVEIQDIAESVFLEKLEQVRPENGCVVVMEVKTGEIKACVNMVRQPDGTYDETDDVAFTTRPEPGSTFKTLSMMVALEQRVVTKESCIETGDKGVWKMYGRNMTDTHKNGKLNMTEVISKSSNIGMSRVIDEYYHDKPGEFVDALYKMGVGKPFNFEIPGTVMPNVRHPADKGVKWSKTTLPWMAIGYETGIPPIYMLAYYNAIANGGKLIKPFLVKSINRNGRVLESFSTETLNSRMCSSRTLEDIRAMLRAVVTDGTGKAANSKHVALAGKTGTAQVDYGKKGVPTRHQITFCGYFPAEKPLYSLIVVMRKPIEPADAGSMCGPVARKIAERVYSQKVNKPLVKNVISTDVPKTKIGQTEALEETFDALNFDYNTPNNAVWSGVRRTNGTFEFFPLAIADKLVPNVVGMGAKDAVFLMEKVGLRVQIYGNGVVRSQSVAAGSRAERGQTVVLTLRK